MNQLAPGKVIGQRYQLVHSIAAGGMGQVFKAVDTRLFNRPVAVKLLHQNLAGDDNTRRQLHKRFQQEIRISTLLGEHPAIVKVLDYGLENDQPYLVMEYLTGRSLGELMLKQPVLPPQQVVRMARQVCAGLYYAHNLETEQDGHLIKGVIHRDIKPSNLFVLKDETLGETVKILDFGIAKLLSDVSLALGTQTTGFLGTVRYASPEQVRGEALDARSDIYSFGVVLYRMLTGQHPLQPKSDSFPGWYEAHNYQQPQPFNRANLPYEIPLELEQVVLSCLAKDPDRRPQDMKVLSAQLEGSLRSQSAASSSLASPPSRTHLLRAYPGGGGCRAVGHTPAQYPGRARGQAVSPLGWDSPFCGHCGEHLLGPASAVGSGPRQRKTACCPRTPPSSRRCRAP